MTTDTLNDIADDLEHLAETMSDAYDFDLPGDFEDQRLKTWLWAMATRVREVRKVAEREPSTPGLKMLVAATVHAAGGSLAFTQQMLDNAPDTLDFEALREQRIVIVTTSDSGRTRGQIVDPPVYGECGWQYEQFPVMRDLTADDLSKVVDGGPPLVSSWSDVVTTLRSVGAWAPSGIAADDCFKAADYIEKNPPGANAMGPGACTSCGGLGYHVDDHDGTRSLQVECPICDGSGKVGAGPMGLAPTLEDLDDERREWNLRIEALRVATELVRVIGSAESHERLTSVVDYLIDNPPMTIGAELAATRADLQAAYDDLKELDPVVRGINEFVAHRKARQNVDNGKAGRPRGAAGRGVIR